MVASLLRSHLLPKVPFLFSYWEEYFNLCLCEKKVLASSLKLVNSALQTAPLLQGPGKTATTYMVSAIFWIPWSTRMLKIMKHWSMRCQTFLYMIKWSFLFFPGNFSPIDWLNFWNLRFCCCQLFFSVLEIGPKLRQKPEKDGLLLWDGTENPSKLLLGGSCSYAQTTMITVLTCTGRVRSDMSNSILVLFGFFPPPFHFKIRDRSLTTRITGNITLCSLVAH